MEPKDKASRIADVIGGTTRLDDDSVNVLEILSAAVKARRRHAR